MKPIDSEIANKQSEQLRHQDMLTWLHKHRDTLANLSDSANINAYGSNSIWINVTSREDLAVAMATGTIWSKSTDGNIMVYTLQVGDFVINIRARSGALPKTCKVVTETVSYPAQPARTELVEKIVCDL
jgi:hypothetical protein